MCLIRPDKFRYTVDPGLAWGFALMIFCEVLRLLLSDEHTVKPQTETFKTCFPVFYFSVSKTSICSWSSSRCRRTVSNSFFMRFTFSKCVTHPQNVIYLLYFMHWSFDTENACLADFKHCIPIHHEMRMSWNSRREILLTSWRSVMTDGLWVRLDTLSTRLFKWSSITCH